MGIKFLDLGIIDYEKAWKIQEELFEKVIAQKMEAISHESFINYLIFCEHPHVYTLGKSGDENNLLINEEFLKSIDAGFYKINRGGDITYHGPGQLVGYPIIDLEQFGLGLKRYIELLEGSIIKLLSNYGLEGAILEGATGVWLESKHPANARKICAIGVRSSRYVTMHGFALNVNTDLNYFTYINPCGLSTKGVTSLKKELKGEQNLVEIKYMLREIILNEFNSLKR